MHEIIAVYHNWGTKDSFLIDDDLRKVIFTNADNDHVTITVVDPRTGVAAEATIRKDSLPVFVTNPNKE